MADHTFNPTIDTWLNEAAATTNYGSSGSISVGAGGTKTTNDQHAIFKFDLTSLGSPYTVGVVSLDYYATSQSKVGTIPNHALQRVTQTAWTEAGATWNKYDGTNNWATAGGDYSTPQVLWVPADGISAYKTIPDSTAFRALVQDAIDNRSGILWLLWKEDNESDTTNQFTVTFDSRTGTNPPILHVADPVAATGRSFGFIF